MRKRPALRYDRSTSKRPKLFGAREITDEMLDAACRAAVFARDGHKCLMCDGTGPLQWCHVFSRGIPSLRREPDNCFSGCDKCHKWFDANRKLGRIWWSKMIGEKRMSELRRTSWPSTTAAVAIGAAENG